MKHESNTPRKAYIIPILQALIQLGGSARWNAVIDQVGEIMADTLNDHDRQPLHGDKSRLRWRSDAVFASSDMVKKGLIIKDRAKGMWHITEAGKDMIMKA